MKLIKYSFQLIFIINISLFAQISLEKELERIKEIPGIKVEYLDENRISVNYSNLKTIVYNLGENLNLKPGKDSIPRFVFNLWEMDTSLFNYKYNFWQEVPLATYSSKEPLLGDINNNGLFEFYGHRKDYFTNFSEVWCYEQDLNGIFKPVYKYVENTLMAYNIFDIDIDGEPELHLVATHLDSVSGYNVHDQTFFKKLAKDSLAKSYYFDYNIYTGDGLNIQLNDFTFGDFNNDSTINAIFHSLLKAVHIVKFNETELTFDSVFTYSTFLDSSNGYEFVTGFTIGDFDLDGKTDIIFSSIFGNIYILENEGGDSYTVNWKGNSGISNSHLNFLTKDLDKNGKPEFWVGGQSFVQGVTRLVCFEMNGDNSYKPVAEIELTGLASLNGLRGMSIDVDNDGIEELFINVGNIVVLIKFIGGAGSHNYEIYYFHQFNNVVRSTTMYKFPDEDYPSIVLSMYHSQSGNRRDFTQIFRHYLTTDVKEESELLNNYNLFNNYPNPFNPTTNVKFSIPERNLVKIKIYNSLGEEIITLLNETLERGEHNVSWDGVNKNNISVPSGVYFITMETQSFRKTIKSILIK